MRWFSRRNRVALVVATVLVMGGVYGYRWWGRAASEGSTRDFTQAASAAFAALSSVPLSPDSDVRGILLSAPVHQPERASEAQLTQLREHAYGFVQHRFLQSSPVEYRRWRQANGASAISKDEMIEEWKIDRAYEHYTGRPFPSEASVTELFDEFFRLGTAFGGGENSPRRIVDDTAGAAVAFGAVSRSNPSFPRFAGKLPPEVWVGSQSVRMRPWFHERASYPELLGAHRELLAATVAVILEYESGNRRPLFLFYVLDPSAGVWTLQSVSVTHPGTARVSALEY